MIYTVTLNPTIDCTMWVDTLEKGKTNRSTDELISVGGKGINVSVVLNELGFPSVATGFIAGFTGDAVEKILQMKGIETDFVRLPEGSTRINVQIKEKNETEINCNGPEVGIESQHRIFEKLERLSKGDVLVLAGSRPRGVAVDFYARIIEKVQPKGVLAIVDTTGQALIEALKYKPFLIKPNLSELEEITGKKLNSIDEIFATAESLKKQGAKNVIVSMGGDGAILVDSNGKHYKAEKVEGRCVNSVGAGDSLVAGFIAGILETGDYELALKLGCSAGAATAFCEGIAEKKNILEVFNR